MGLFDLHKVKQHYYMMPQQTLSITKQLQEIIQLQYTDHGLHNQQQLNSSTNNVINQPSSIPVIVSMLKTDAGDDTKSTILCVLLRRCFQHNQDGLSDAEMMCLTDSLFPLICAIPSPVGCKQLLDIVNMIYSRHWYGEHIKWLLSTVPVSTERALLCLEQVFKIYCRTPVTASVNLYSLFNQMHCEQIMKMCASEHIASTLESIIYNTTLISIDSSVLPSIQECVTLLPSILQQFNNSTKVLHKTYKLIHSLLSSSSALHISTVAISRLIASIPYLAPQTLSQKTLFFVISCITECHEHNILCHFLENTIANFVPQLARWVQMSSDEVDLFYSNEQEFLLLEEDRIVGKYDAYTATKRLLHSLCKSTTLFHTISSCVINSILDPRCQAVEGLTLLLHFMKGPICNRAGEVVPLIHTRIIQPLLSSSNSIQQYYGLVLYEDLCQGLVPSEEVNKTKTRILNICLHSTSTTVCLHAMDCINIFKKELPDRTAHEIFMRCKDVVSFPSYNLINYILYCFITYPTLRAYSLGIMSQICSYCIELAEEHSSLMMDSSSNSTDAMGAILTQMTSLLSTVEHIVAFTDDYTPILSLFSSILRRSYNFIPEIADTIISIMREVSKYTNSFQVLTPAFYEFISQNELEATIPLFPLVVFLQHDTAHRPDIQLIIQYTQSCLLYYYNDEYILASVTFTVKELILSGTLSINSLIQTIVSVYYKCTKPYQYLLLTTICVSILTDTAAALSALNDISFMTVFITNLPTLITGSSPLYDIKLVAMSICPLIWTSMTLCTDNALSAQLFHLLLSLLSQLRTKRTSQQIVQYVEEDSEDDEERVEEEMCPEILRKDESVLFVPLLKQIRNVSAHLLWNLTSEEENTIKSYLSQCK